MRRRPLPATRAAYTASTVPREEVLSLRESTKPTREYQAYEGVPSLRGSTKPTREYQAYEKALGARGSSEREEGGHR
jgi:hypothetical protein